MNFIELSKVDWAKYNQIHGVKIMNKHSESREADVYYAVWTTEDLGDVTSEEFPTLQTCQNYTKKILQQITDLEEENDSWKLGDEDGD